MFYSSFFPLNNTIKDYEWGSKSSLKELFGFENKSNAHQAELWMGIHPCGCSLVKVDTEEISLSSLINRDKDDILSKRVSDEFGELPFLFKVLAAESPLSVQVHPNKTQAIDGFNTENELGISIDSAIRNYKDENHKPELVYAITQFQVMAGFKSYQEINECWSYFSVPKIDKAFNGQVEINNDHDLELFFSILLTLSGDDKIDAVSQLKNYVKDHKYDHHSILVNDLLQRYADDLGAFSPLLLNVFTLNPGQSLFITSGIPHAYIHGTALEVMANSDNVLRAGLTNKNIDIVELTKCTNFKPTAISELICNPVSIAGNISRYEVPVSDFCFEVYSNSQNQLISVDSAEIVFSLDDSLTLRHESGEVMTIDKGDSVFIPHYAKSYSISAIGRVIRVFC
ncbi:mannose-6-phosphate isomerase, class I [Photobacterium sp. Hal280]|uniref:mannose-6-phosphate isomerase, class I n=1 Tax=Photobacterium sp. Hal280 TaxID=3035163 RepID=UPI00301BC5FA